ncbi:hypothetical protein N7463_006281 [Penicillium fimorum]|uniref:Uncharacterized protein n=1 Tax=Penicillium fimorum TaxID=1882269 RepID=A0A9X0C610_9EURO|nr:hypothetical protein N7463_006281 [Penicillium fimorum]
MLKKALFSGACMKCPFVDRASRCSFRSPLAPKWILEWTLANNPDRPLPDSVAQVTGHISVSAHTGVPFSVHDGSAASTSARPKQHGPVYSAKWYKPPLDDRSLAKDINGIISVREDLRGIRARVAYDIKKLSRFAGDDGSEEETLGDNELNPFYDSDSAFDDDHTGSAPAKSEKVESEVKSGDVGSSDIDSVDVGSLSVCSVDLDLDDVDGNGDVDADK